MVETSDGRKMIIISDDYDDRWYFLYITNDLYLNKKNEQLNPSIDIDLIRDIFIMTCDYHDNQWYRQTIMIEIWYDGSSAYW